MKKDLILCLKFKTISDVDRFQKELNNGGVEINFYAVSKANKKEFKLSHDHRWDKTTYRVFFFNANPDKYNYFYVLKCKAFDVNHVMVALRWDARKGFLPIDVVMGGSKATQKSSFKVKGMISAPSGKPLSSMLNPGDVAHVKAQQYFHESVFSKEKASAYGVPTIVKDEAPVDANGNFSLKKDFYWAEGFPPVKLTLSVQQKKDGIWKDFPLSSIKSPKITNGWVTHAEKLGYEIGTSSEQAPSGSNAQPATDAQAKPVPANEVEPERAATERTPEDLAREFAEEQDAILSAMPKVSGFYSKAEAAIRIRNPHSGKTVDAYESEIGRLPIGDFRWMVAQPQNPIYGFASVHFDYLAYGQTIVHGNFLVSTGDYNAVNRMISNSDPFGYHHGDSFDIEILVGDPQFHRGMKKWFRQQILIEKARLTEAVGDHTLSGEPGAVMYAFIGRRIRFNLIVEEMSDTYSVATSRSNPEARELPESDANSSAPNSAAGTESNRYAGMAAAAEQADLDSPKGSPAGPLKDGSKETQDAKKASSPAVAQEPTSNQFNVTFNFPLESRVILIISKDGQNSLEDRRVSFEPKGKPFSIRMDMASGSQYRLAFHRNVPSGDLLALHVVNPKYNPETKTWSPSGPLTFGPN